MTPPDSFRRRTRAAKQPGHRRLRASRAAYAALPRRGYGDAAGRHRPGRVRGADRAGLIVRDGGGGAAAPLSPK